MARIGPAEFSGAFEAHANAMVLYARQFLDAAAAEDVVQDVFLRLMGQRRPPANVKAWLYRSVRNAAINRMRSQRRRSRHEQRKASVRAGWFESRVDDLVDAKAAQEALATLPPEQREIVVLRIWAQLTLQDIAQTVHAPVSTVHSRYKAALTAVRTAMGVSRCDTKNH